jgi:hypothetical protein
MLMRFPLTVAALALAAAAGAQQAPEGAFNDQPEATAVETPGPVTTHQLLNMRRKALEALYKTLPPGPIPDGKSNGIASREPGTVFGKISQKVLGAFWQGKVFDRAGGQLINRLTTGESIKAKVFVGESWLDGKPAIIIDYKDTSRLAGFIRDEIREAAPGVYFGFAYERQQDGSAHANVIFALDFNSPKDPKAEEAKEPQ